MPTFIIPTKTIPSNTNLINDGVTKYVVTSTEHSFGDVVERADKEYIYSVPTLDYRESIALPQVTRVGELVTQPDVDDNMYIVTKIFQEGPPSASNTGYLLNFEKHLGDEMTFNYSRGMRISTPTDNRNIFLNLKIFKAVNDGVLLSETGRPKTGVYGTSKYGYCNSIYFEFVSVTPTLVSVHTLGDNTQKQEWEASVIVNTVSDGTPSVATFTFYIHDTYSNLLRKDDWVRSTDGEEILKVTQDVDTAKINNVQRKDVIPDHMLVYKGVSLSGRAYDEFNLSTIRTRGSISLRLQALAPFDTISISAAMGNTVYIRVVDPDGNVRHSKTHKLNKEHARTYLFDIDRGQDIPAGSTAEVNIVNPITTGFEAQVIKPSDGYPYIIFGENEAGGISQLGGFKIGKAVRIGVADYEISTGFVNFENVIVDNATGDIQRPKAPTPMETTMTMAVPIVDIKDGTMIDIAKLVKGQFLTIDPTDSMLAKNHESLPPLVMHGKVSDINITTHRKNNTLAEYATVKLSIEETV